MRARAVVLLCLSLAGCRLAGPGAPRASGPPPVVVQPGSISGSDQEEASRLLRAAQASFEARRYFEVLRTTSDLLDRFPGSDASGEALLLSARAELAVGASDRADAAAERYVNLLPPGDSRSADARLIQAEAWEGDAPLQLDRLLRIGSEADTVQMANALTMARAAADSLDTAQLALVLASAPAGSPLVTVVESRQAVNLLEDGDQERATTMAQAALDDGAYGEERTLAEGVLRGELPPGRGRIRSFRIATALPRGGPPAMAEYAALVAEGVEVAASTVLGDPYEVSVVPLDDEADPTVAAGLVPELEGDSVDGVVGFLEDQTLVSAGLARRDSLPIVSPTARSADEAGPGVFSLEGPDPEAAASIARYAASRAYQRVAIILPDSRTGIAEADAFQAQAEGLGIPVVGRYRYQPGATYFESQIIGASDALRAEEIAALRLGPDDTLHVEVLDPVAIFLPIPAEDVEFLAPQIAHFALDTLAVELIGTSGWTDPQQLELLEPRYTNGVVATAPEGAGPDSPGLIRFQTAYEEYFQRTLISPTPAIGYDAALLLLEALRPGRVEHGQVIEALEGLRDVEGATGILSVVDGRVVRRTRVVRIENRALIPIPVQ